MVPRVMHAIIDIRAYQFRYNKGKLSQKMEMELLFPPEGEKESLAIYVVAWSSPPLSVEASMSAAAWRGPLEGACLCLRYPVKLDPAKVLLFLLLALFYGCTTPITTYLKAFR